MLPKRLQRSRSHGRERPLRIWTECDAGADFSEGMSGFVDVDGEVRVFEEADGQADSAYAAANDGDVDGGVVGFIIAGFGGSGGVEELGHCEHVDEVWEECFWEGLGNWLWG